jgi:P-type Cu+ transporter
MDKTVRLSISGMACAGCVTAVEDALKSVEGVNSAIVNLGERTAVVSGNANVQMLLNAVKSAGYSASELVTLQDEDEKTQRELTEYRKLVQRVLVSGAIGVSLFVCGMGGFLPSLESNASFWSFISFVTLAVLVFVGGHFFTGAWNALRNRRGNMDTLVAMGTGTAWLYSSVVVFFPELIPDSARHVYFEAAVIIIALVSLGSALEMRARGKTSSAIRQLINLQPKQARVIRNGQEMDLPLEEVGIEETLRIYPGARVPLDGIVIDGQSHVDEAMLTGEPVPVQKVKGDKLVGGTINGNGMLMMSTTHIGRDTVLARIIELVRNAQASKPAIGKFVDKVSAVFVPVVVLVALISFMLWMFLGPEPQISYAIVAAMTVLVIACPCALGLATPISIMVAVGRAANMGMLIRNGDSLQRSEQVTTVVFDKTGTITIGKPKVTGLKALGGIAEERLLKLAASVEKNSDHPLATAIVSEAERRDLQLPASDEFHSETGKGLLARVESETILIGNSQWMKDNKIDLTALQSQATQCLEQAITPVYVASGNQLIGMLEISDPLKPESKAAIDNLHRQGLSVVMLTGDHDKVAQSVASQLGIDEVFAELLPDDKIRQIQEFQNEGKTVLMVGDGINDAPALAQADVGIAIGAGTDIAIESADVVLMRGSIQGVADFIALSKATMRNIKQNLLGAFFYNTLGIPLAAGVFYPVFGLLLSPVAAAAAMSLSSVTVVSNALRLRSLSLHKTGQ